MSKTSNPKNKIEQVVFPLSKQVIKVGHSLSQIAGDTVAKIEEQDGDIYVYGINGKLRQKMVGQPMYIVIYK